MLRRLQLLQREAIRIKPRRSYGFRAMAKGDAFYGAEEIVYDQVILKAHPNRITRNPMESLLGQTCSTAAAVDT